MTQLRDNGDLIRIGSEIVNDLIIAEAGHTRKLVSGQGTAVGCEDVRGGG